MRADELMTITMNTYQVITKDEPIAPVLYSDYKRGGGIAIVIPKLGRCGNVRNADIAQCERSAADAGQESF